MSFARMRARLKDAMPTASMSVATLALVVATTGGVAAYAGSKIGTNQIKNNAVTSAKIKNGTVAKADLNRTVRPQALIWRPGPEVDAAYNSAGYVKITERTVKYPTKGLLEVNASAIGVGGTAPDLVLALVDYDGDLGVALDSPDPAETLKLYNSIAYLFSTDGTSPSIDWPRLVAKGSHRIEVYAISNTAMTGDPVTLGLRQLTAVFTPGAVGTQQPWSVPLPRSAPDLQRLGG